jgi:hypothetical protein
MPMFNLSVRHGRTLDDARARLETAVGEVRARFGPMVRRVTWSDDRRSVHVEGAGFMADLRVDEQEVHASGDFPALAALLGRPVEAGLKQIVQQTFGPPGTTGAGR